MKDLSDLFRPFHIGSLELKNRIVMLPMHIRLDPTTEQGRVFYVTRARGGVGAIVTWATAVDLLLSDTAWGQAGAIAAFATALSSLVQDVHQADARIGMQLGEEMKRNLVLSSRCILPQM
jgi:2,4-dienoyl-CoA reductase (NADPH2)